MGKAVEKITRMKNALSHREGDHVPTGEFFWTGFLKRCREKWGADFDPYRYFDLDYIVITPNMDPKIQSFETIEQTEDNVVIRTGFGATIRRRKDFPMPRFEAFSVNTPDEMELFTFDDPTDPRRFYNGGDDQLNCVADTLVRDIPSWDERLQPYVDDFAVFGSICEPYEYLWRIIGSENSLLWMAEAPDQLAEFINRIGAFLLETARAQITAGKGRLCGMYIWGDVAYRKGMLFGADRWRHYFKPHVQSLINLCRENNLMTVYHGCGDAQEIFDDAVEMGINGYNPLEAKAGLDVVKLKKRYAGKLAFVGNIDVRILETGDSQAIRNEIRYKLQAAKGGGWVFQSDHSISSAVAPESYELALQTLREYGVYPLQF